MIADHDDPMPRVVAAIKGTFARHGIDTKDVAPEALSAVARAAIDAAQPQMLPGDRIIWRCYTSHTMGNLWYEGAAL